MSPYEDAIKLLHPMCPRCQEERAIERINHEWFCPRCAKSWPVAPKP